MIKDLSKYLEALEAIVIVKHKEIRTYKVRVEALDRCTATTYTRA